MTRQLPPFYDATKVSLLNSSIRSAAATPRELWIFSSIVRRLRDELLELEALYAELPGVLDGDHGATEQFLAILNRSGPPGEVGGGGGADSLAAFARAVRGAPAPCAISFMVDPSAVLILAQGVALLANGDTATYERFAGTVHALWERAAPLDDLLHQARPPHATGGPSRLAASLRATARDFEKAGWIFPETPGSGELPSGGFGEGYPVPDGVGPGWGPDDGPRGPLGPGLPLVPPSGLPGLPPKGPPEGPPGLPIDPCEFQADLCRRWLRVGLSAFGPLTLPPSTWSVGISGISPNPACPGEVMTIAGTGFGQSQPAAWEVVIGGTPVQVLSWSDTEIEVRIPNDGMIAGCVGFRDKDKEAALQAEVLRRRKELGQLAEALNCLGTPLDTAFAEIPWIPSSPPCTEFNRFLGSFAIVDYFVADGWGSSLVVEPGKSFTLSWSVRNADQLHLKRIGTTGPHLDQQITLPSRAGTGTTQPLGPFTETTPVDAQYELTAQNRCHTATEKITVRLRQFPLLEVKGVELTQAIQLFTFDSPNQNPVPLVGHKDTIARVYVSADIKGFMADTVKITGSLKVGNTLLQPLNAQPLNAGPVEARPRYLINRADPAHTLTFRIPAPLSVGTQPLNVEVWADPVPRPPQVPPERPKASWSQQVGWVAVPPHKVRYVRVQTTGPDGQPALLTDAQAREDVLRAFDILPRPATDIAPARIPIWHSSLDLTEKAGIDELAYQLHDQHNCSITEWLGLQEDACPDDAGEVWVGLVPLEGGSGATVDMNWPTYTVNTCAVQRDRMGLAHELGHTLRLLHVNPSVGCPGKPEGPYAPAPNGGKIAPADTMDPNAVQPVFPEPDQELFDFMSYSCDEWVSPYHWYVMIILALSG